MSSKRGKATANSVGVEEEEEADTLNAVQGDLDNGHDDEGADEDNDEDMEEDE